MSHVISLIHHCAVNIRFRQAFGAVDILDDSDFRRYIQVDPASPYHAKALRVRGSNSITLGEAD